MITESWLELAPAYGRDYTSGKEAKADFLSGKDWEQTSIMRNGTYCSINDFAPGTKVLLRYRQLRQVASVTVPMRS